jgi:predicted membrane-bound dolichyl-phosphate-mannose-protein mannosyltransferase
MTDTQTGFIHRAGGWLARLAAWEYAPMCLLLLVVLGLHLDTIYHIKGLVFDENYYVPAAHSILAGEGSDIAGHPPLGQLLISWGFWIFGSGPLGWRIASVVFSLIGVAFFYLICRQLNISKGVSLLATCLLGVESMSFFMGSIAMLDVFCLTFMLAAFWAYLKKIPLLAGLMLVLAALAKLNGWLALAVMLLHWLLTQRRDIKQAVILTAASLASFLIILPLLDLIIWQQWLNPFERIGDMLAYTGGITFADWNTAPMGAVPSRPWEWLGRMVYMQALAFDSAKLEWYVQSLLVISPAVWILIIPSILYMAYRAFKRSRAALFVTAWFSGTYLVWLLLSPITDRLSYVFYFYPSIGAVCIGIALGLVALQGYRPQSHWLRKLLPLLTPLYLLTSLAVFVAFCPGSLWWQIIAVVILYALVRWYADKKRELAPQPAD